MVIAKRDATMVAWGTMPAAVQLPEQSPGDRRVTL
jgi:hypothetical protein